MGEKDEQEQVTRDPFPTHNDADKMVYEFKNSDNDPNRELTEAQAEDQLRERTGVELETEESASTKSSTKTTATKPTSTPKEK